MSDADALPTYELRQHVLAACIRTAETELRAHGYHDPKRSLEVIVAAIDDVVAEDDGVAEEALH